MRAGSRLPATATEYLITYKFEADGRPYEPKEKRLSIT